MKKLSLVLSAALLTGIGSQALAQVQDVSFTVAPVAGYTHWDKKLNLGDAPYWGVRAGFGFGPLFEVRGLYERSFDLKGKLQSKENPKWLQDWADKLEESNVDITRYGGELKLNLWSNAFLTPYLTAGGGVMKFAYTGKSAAGLPTDYKEEQIYGAGGLGLKFNLGRRVSLSFEGKDLIFNVNQNNRYLAEPASAGKQLHNWTGQASLDIYFGGSTYRPTDAVSRAYRNLYTGGFRGLKFVLEPGVAYADFAQATGLEDQWFVGGSAGVDFSSIFGLRGFYYAATKKPGTLDLNLNNELRMYGGNFLARLNMPLGLTPYLNLGAGYLEVTKKFVPTIAGAEPKSGLFLFGGGGLEIPLHKYVALHGSINAMLTERANPDITKVTDPADVKVSTFYQAGVRFNFGRSSRDGRALYQSYSDAQTQSEVARLQEANLEELNALRAQYDSRIKKLNAELAEAVSRRDTVTVTRVLQEKSEVNSRISDVENQTTQLAIQPQPAYVAPAYVAPDQRSVTLTKAQFDLLVDQVVSDLKRTKAAPVSAPEFSGSSFSDLDKILLLNALYRSPYAQMPMQQLHPYYHQQPQACPSQQAQPQVASADPAKVDANIALIKRMDQVIDRLDNLALQQAAPVQKEVKSSSNDRFTATEELLRDSRDRIVVADRKKNGTIYAQEVKVKKAEDIFFFNRASLFVGPNFGDDTQLNVGARAYLQLRNTNFDLVPDAYVGLLGDKLGFGVNANLIYNLPSFFDGAIAPYLGVGLGFNSTATESRFLPNFVIGTTLGKVLGGRLFADYTARGLVRNHQIAVGYSFHF
ncbi:outer membrane beta-barrel protein [uncultured Porphyromonas sp.]|uniref:outer membrane beta-barrel protein n=1 Tax=uncultured Porphyromonas sp. TaxID=159274 RepID=UPI002613C1B5|nr:outer membrane beta-barrel protein [uncultured Porphyromonas sp.]